LAELEELEGLVPWLLELLPVLLGDEPLEREVPEE
jgi:hypothetical protein